MTAMLKAGHGGSQEPGSEARSPHGWQEPNYLSHHCCLPGSALSKRLESQARVRN